MNECSEKIFFSEQDTIFSSLKEEKFVREILAEEFIVGLEYGSSSEMGVPCSKAKLRIYL